MGWWITLAIIFLLAILPLGASVNFDEDGLLVRILAGPLKIQVYPLKKRNSGPKPKKEKKKEPKPEEKKNEPKEPAKPEEKKGGSLTDFLPLVQVALDMLGDFRRKLRVNYLKLHLNMAADDPCDLAVNYGRANAAMSGLLAQLDRLFVIKKQSVRINCDFAADETVILARLDVTITLGRIIALVVRYGIRALLTFMKIQKQQEEGGANL